jgi:MoaA/NifB/PqqE/SkfB family radical SAM enzyme
VAALKRSGLTCLNISLDSALAEEHDAARAAPGCHEAAVRAMGFCRELRQPCMASCYATRETAASGGLRRLIEAASAAGAGAVRILPPVASGSWSGHFEELALDESDREAVLAAVWGAPLPVLDRTELPDCELSSAYKIMVLPDGGLAPCEHLPYVFRGTEEMGLVEALDRAVSLPLLAKGGKCWPRSADWLKDHPEALRGGIVYLDL